MTRDGPPCSRSSIQIPRFTALCPAPSRPRREPNPFLSGSRRSRKLWRGLCTGTFFKGVCIFLSLNAVGSRSSRAASIWRVHAALRLCFPSSILMFFG